MSNQQKYPLRLDQALFVRGMAQSRTRAETLIREGLVRVNNKAVAKPSHTVKPSDVLTVAEAEQYVSRAGNKLASVAKALGLDFKGKVVLDVGSSTGGFTEYALKHGAAKVVAVDVGTNQLHPTLRANPLVELHEKTDIRDYTPREGDVPIELVVMDVSFVSSRMLLPHIANIVSDSAELAVMVKPQFEAGKHQVNKGVIKNDTVRRTILQEFEQWAKQYFVIANKSDSLVAGEKGNVERFYLLKKLQKA